jgi:hypothetical protein
VQILTCQHCRTKVAVGSDCICPSCRKPTTDVRLSAAEAPMPPSVVFDVQIPDTNTNRVFRTASFFCAGLQVVLVISIDIMHSQPVVGGNPLEQLAGFVAVLTIIPVLLLLQVIGSAFGLGAGRFKITCIVSNIVCCAFFAFIFALSLIF